MKAPDDFKIERGIVYSAYDLSLANPRGLRQ